MGRLVRCAGVRITDLLKSKNILTSDISGIIFLKIFQSQPPLQSSARRGPEEECNISVCSTYLDKYLVL